jgi:DNA modification methylase
MSKKAMKVTEGLERMAKPMADCIELWAIERLIPSARNARTHSDEQIAEIAGSIHAFGFIVPVVVGRDGVVIAGHGRVLAARQLKLDCIPVIEVTHLSDAEQRAYAIADNKIALNAGWNEELLKVELEALKDEGVSLDSLGFSEEEFNALMDELAPEAVPDEDSVPETPLTPVTRVGDIWQLGEHRLLCGDALDPGAYTTLLSGELTAMVFCDPPYNVEYVGPGLGVGIANDDLGEGFGTFLQTACEHMLANTRGAVYVCMSSSELHTLYEAFTTAGGHWSTFLIWGKHHFTLGRSDYQRQFEPILYGWKEGTQRYWCGARDQGDLWLIDRPHANDLHPTMKPVELVERAVLNSSKRGEAVLDAFGGSGTTLIACEKTGRKARLIEVDPHFCDVIVQRWQDFTGGAAILENDERSFVEVAEERLSASPAEVEL